MAGLQYRGLGNCITESNNNLTYFFIDVDSRPWDFQAEECSLRCAVDRFNHRRYEKTSQSAAAATARAAAAAAAAGGNAQDAGSNRDIIVSKQYLKLIL